ncbi:hypothetical protein AVEN_41843-1 [Araneus ventricosus]|uniref:DUF4817 domain-containing protein n=1 Tax=Araneus ventricosus TaxID=182803 RepID=A0A4Y2AC68_ARAVE|nr:hypothetical protein AVEN_41843-1 [Araneus ventricosus]
MPLTKEERADILLPGSDTTRHVARTFNAATQKTQTTHDTVIKLIMKFKRKVPSPKQADLEDPRRQQMMLRQHIRMKEGSVADASRSGRPKTVTHEGTSTQVLAVARSPKKEIRRLPE